jgi:hypothetical protein
MHNAVQRFARSSVVVGVMIMSTITVAAEVTFERDVMAVLSKARCNAGTCHGNVHGKGGFFLSLRGQDPEFDYQQLVRGADGRRVNRMFPKKSLAVLKPSASIAHEGGKRFDIDSPEYRILTQWIAEGLAKVNSTAAKVVRLEVQPIDVVLWQPENRQALQVIAHFDNGEQQDVTRLAVFETSDASVEVSAGGVVQFDQPGIVTVLVRYLDGQSPARLTLRPAKSEFTWSAPEENGFIDELIFSRLKQLQLNPAPLATDQVFMRRLHLDLLGVLPTAEEAKRFVDSTNPNKREELIDQLLERPEFAAQWALKWSDLIRNEEKQLDAKGVELLHAWIRDSFAADKPLDEFARELIASRGSTYTSPPTNFWRAHREPYIRAETTAQVFLGVRLKCAKCHNHPFDRWSQDEYYSWASLFSTIDYEIVDNKRKDKLDKHEFVGEQIVKVKSEGHVINARTGEPALAMFLSSNQPVVDGPVNDGPVNDGPVIDAPNEGPAAEEGPTQNPEKGDRLQQLATWIASGDNRMFAEAQANRIWYHVMGRGLVEPVDDLRLTNPASHPELLARLTDELVAGNFSLRHLVRTIVLSRTYQLSSEFHQPQAEKVSYDDQMYGRAIIRRLTAEQILDAQSHILGIPATFAGYPSGTRAGELAGVERVRKKLGDGDRFLRLFGKPERLLACECERTDEPTLGQALRLVGGKSLNERLQHPKNRIGLLLSTVEPIAEPTVGPTKNNGPTDEATKRTAQHKAVIEELFWSSLTRPPTPGEIAATLQLIESTGNPRVALEDLTWAILNAKELIFRN